jgi:hypothetical protein
MGIEEVGHAFMLLVVSTYLYIIGIIHKHVQKPYSPNSESVTILPLQFKK